MANFGWKYGAASAGDGDDCPTCNPSASCSADISALWTSPYQARTITYDGYFETPFASGSQASLIWTQDNPQSASFS